MSEDIEEQVVKELESDKAQFSLQVDESTDISGKAQLLAFIRYIHKKDIINQFLCCKELTESTTGNDVFTIINEYITKCGINWKSCVGVCTDGAPSMIDSVKGFCTLVKKENPNVIITHCFIHREALVAKTIPSDLKEVLNQVVKTVNFIKSRPQQTRIFKKLCEVMQSQHKILIFHTEVRWLSKGRVLARVYELRDELLTYFTLEESEYANYFSDDSWIAKVAFLSDLFEHLNKLNISMQGKDENILVSQGKIAAFQDKLNLWLRYVGENNFEMFLLLNKTLLNNQYPSKQVSETIQGLVAQIVHYFPSIDVKCYDWIRDPFLTSPGNQLNLKEQEELIDIKNDGSLQI